MSLTVDRPVEPTPGEPPRALARAEGLELLGEVSGSGYKDGRRARPPRRRADGAARAAAVRAARGGRRGARPRRARRRDVRAARARASTSRARRQRSPRSSPSRACSPAPRRTRRRRSNPLLALRWKVLVHRPEGDRAHHRAVRAAVPAVDRAARRSLGFAVVVWFVLIHKGVASATAQAFDKPRAAAARPRPARRVGGPSTRSATRRRAATAAAGPAAWAPASTSSGRPSTPT